MDKQIRNSTAFWCSKTSVLKEFAIKGFVLDKKRLENGSFLNQNYMEKYKNQM